VGVAKSDWNFEKVAMLTLGVWERKYGPRRAVQLLGHEFWQQQTLLIDKLLMILRVMVTCGVVPKDEAGLCPDLGDDFLQCMRDNIHSGP
jgi:hypothetical protein